MGLKVKLKFLRQKTAASLTSAVHILYEPIVMSSGCLSGPGILMSKRH